MHTTLAILLSLVLASSAFAQRSPRAPQPRASNDVDVQLVLAADISRSMDLEEVRIQREGYLAALRHKEFIDAVKGGLTGRIAIAYFEWAGDVVPGSIIDWHIISGEEDASIFATKLESHSIATERRTSISAAITQGASMIISSPFRGMRQVIDISGDGPNNSGSPVLPVRDKAIEAGITINGLALMLGPSGLPQGLDQYYANCVSGGPGSFVIPVHKIEDFATAVRRKLVMEISQVQPAATIHRIAGPKSPAETASDCLDGERQWQNGYDRF